MRTMTMRNVGYAGERDAMASCPLNLGKQLQRFQRRIETSDWDQWLIRHAARFDRALLGAVILLAVAFFLSWSRIL
jgi:hypothetical protein